MKSAQLFVYSAGSFLLITSTAKLISSFGNGAILQTYDPLTGLKFQDLFRIVASIERIVALVCFLSKRILLPAGLIAWLATIFLAYRIGLVATGYHRPCSCMGNLTDALHIPPQTADTAMKIIGADQTVDGIEIQVDRGTDFVFLAIDTIPDYTDTAPMSAVGQSALWKYKAIYHQDDDRVGQWSDVVSIPVAG
jgi:hypothetical protein